MRLDLHWVEQECGDEMPSHGGPQVSQLKYVGRLLKAIMFVK